MSSPNDNPSMHTSHGRALLMVVIVAGAIGGTAFFRSHETSMRSVSANAGISSEEPLQAPQIAALSAMNQAQEDVAKRVAPAVVRIAVTAQAKPGSDDGSESDNPFAQLFPQFGGGQMGRGQQPQIEHGQGSGVIISPDGYIVTNNHVVDSAETIEVYLNDKRRLTARVVGTDELTDIAVIKIDATGLSNLPWGDSKEVRQGDTVFAFGNPFGEAFSFSMTRGIVSGLGRLAPSPDRNARAPQDFIQTDAAINPGNSGGPLVDIRGQIIGINAFIYTSTGTFNGAGFAIPAEVAEPTVHELIAHGKVIRGYLGISIQPMDPSFTQFFGVSPGTEGALIGEVTSDSPAEKAGLKRGDIISTFNGNKVADATQLQLYTGGVAPGTKVTLGIIRDGKPMSLPVTLGSVPASMEETASAKPETPHSVGVQLGLTPSDITPQLRARYQIPDSVKGALIMQVTPGGPADDAGLSRGFVITEINHIPVGGADDLNAQLRKVPAGHDVLLLLSQPGGGGSIYLVVHPAPIAPGGGGKK